MSSRKIILTGETDGRRMVVYIDGQRIRLTFKSYKYFLHLCWARVMGDGKLIKPWFISGFKFGWVYRSGFDYGHRQTAVLHRMKREIGIDGWPVFESDWCGRVRLLDDGKDISLKGPFDLRDAEAMAMIEDMKAIM